MVILHKIYPLLGDPTWNFQWPSTTSSCPRSYCMTPNWMMIIAQLCSKIIVGSLQILFFSIQNTLRICISFHKRSYLMCTIFTIIISESKLSEIAMSFQILFSSYIILLFFDKYLILCKEGSRIEEHWILTLLTWRSYSNPNNVTQTHSIF